MNTMLYTLIPNVPPAFSFSESLPIRELRRGPFALWVGSAERMERCMADLPDGLSGILLFSDEHFSFSRRPSGLFLMTVPERLIQELHVVLPGFLSLVDELEKQEEAIRSQALELKRSREDQVRLVREFAGFRESLVREISERKRTEEELQKLSRQQSVILENSTVGIALVRNRVFEWVNTRLPELFGLPPDQCQGAPTRIIYPSDEVYDRVGAEAYPRFREGQKASLELELRRGEHETFWCRLEGKALDPANPAEGVIWIAEDISARKESENELKKHRDHLEELVRERTAELQEKNNQLMAEIAERKRMETELLHAQKMESIGHLAAGIAHEINTPIQFIGDNLRFLKTSVAGMLELINRYEPLKAALKSDCAALLEDLAQAEQDADLEYLREEMPKALDQSEDGVKRVSKIVLAMKDFSHPSSDEMTPTDINRAIETTATIARNEWKYAAELETRLDPALPLVPCLPGDINQVLLNLIVNAAHAIAEVPRRGDTITGKIVISTCRDGDSVEIRVADNGPGIREEHREHIFTPFFTTKEVGKGTGQGLALSYNVIVKKHQGSIRFETETGKGTTFIIRLPLTRPGFGG